MSFQNRISGDEVCDKKEVSAERMTNLLSIKCDVTYYRSFNSTKGLKYATQFNVTGEE